MLSAMFFCHCIPAATMKQQSVYCITKKVYTWLRLDGAS